MASPHPAQQGEIRGVCLMRNDGRGAPLCSGEGYADAVLVVGIEQRPVGYISYHHQGHGEGWIGLSSIWERGLSGTLGSVQRITVVTQGRNCAGQRVYQHCGFLIRGVHLWYHRWFSGEKSVG